MAFFLPLGAPFVLPVFHERGEFRVMVREVPDREPHRVTPYIQGEKSKKNEKCCPYGTAAERRRQRAENTHSRKYGATQLPSMMRGRIVCARVRYALLPIFHRVGGFARGTRLAQAAKIGSYFQVACFVQKISEKPVPVAPTSHFIVPFGGYGKGSGKGARLITRAAKRIKFCRKRPKSGHERIKSSGASDE
jgi:hypothetical protein